jgi:photosystem II stability/assembly factor-like uncharacterized protein
MNLLSALLLSSLAWTSSGPLGGAVTAVVVAPSNPAVVWAGSSAGVFRSIDGGATWNNVSGPVADVARLAVHPLNPEKAFALTSAGLFVTSDGGATWTLNKQFAGIWPSGLFFDPRNPDTVYVAGGCFAGFEPVYYPAMGLHRSNDGGATWTMISPSPGSIVQCVIEAAVDPFSPWRIFTTGPYSDIAGRLETYDRAAKWEFVKAPRPSAGVVFDPRYPFTHYGITQNFGPFFLVSQDGGFTWTATTPSLPNVAPQQYTPLNALTIDPERGRLFLGTTARLYRSGNGGRTWAPTRLDDVSVDAIDFGGTPASVFAATNDGLFRVENRGLGEALPIDLHQIATLTEALGIDPSDPKTLYVSTTSTGNVYPRPLHPRVFRSTDGGASWEQIPGDNGEEMIHVAIDAAGTLYASSFRNANLYRRRRGETEWTVVRPGIIYDMAADPKNAGTLFIITNRGIERSRDSGNNWQTVHELTGGHLAIDSSDPRWIYAGGEYGLWRSSDGGTTWEDIQPEPKLLNGTRGIEVAPSNGSVVYRIAANFGRPGPERSDDHGTTWHAATLTGGVYPSALAVDPRDANSVWAAVSQYGSGLYRSNDGGQHWEEVPGPFGTDVNASALRFDPSGKVLHVAYPGHGVWELTLD